MAFRRRRGGFRGRRRFGRNRPRWTADFVSLDPGAGAIAQQNICSEADFGTSGTLESEALVHRILVSGDIAATVGAGTAVVQYGICKNNENVTPTFGAVNDPGLVDSLVDDDWLWTGEALLVFDADAGFIHRRLDADIRVKRKMISTDVLRFVVSNAAGGVAAACRATVRILLEPRV